MSSQHYFEARPQAAHRPGLVRVVLPDVYLELATDSGVFSPGRLDPGTRFLLDQAITSAGRHPDSDIFLDDVTVSRRHAEFRLENNEFHVVDVGSLNGTYVNREPVDSAVLANGDEVQIGKFRLVFLTGPKQGDNDGGTGG